MHFQPRRRAILRTVPAAGLLLGGAGCATQSGSTAGADPWKRADDIVARFATPQRFREEDFPITAYGAQPCSMVATRGQTASLVNGALRTPAPDSPDAYPAITQAIKACNASDGWPRHTRCVRLRAKRSRMRADSRKNTNMAEASNQM